MLGFRKCGVYPSNPNAIDCSFSVVNPEASLRQSNTEKPSDHNIDINEKTLPEINDSSNISSKKRSLYQRRFEEGYDLPDEEYTKWLKVNYPESFVEQSNDNDNNGETDSLTLADAFCNVPVASPDAIVDTELKGDQMRKDEVDNAVRYDETATVEEPCNKLKYISKYLVQFVPNAKPKNTETAVRISGARVLTSDKCVTILKEREEKRKQ